MLTTQSVSDQGTSANALYALVLRRSLGLTDGIELVDALQDGVLSIESLRKTSA